MSRRKISITCAGFLVQLASALLPSLRTATPSGAFPNPPLAVALSTSLKKPHLSFRHGGSKISLSSTISGDETAQEVEVAAEDTQHHNSHEKTTVSNHLQKASLAQSKTDVPTQQKEVGYAERMLVQWVEQYRGRRSQSADTMVEQFKLPDDQIFSDVIEGLLTLPSSFAMTTDVRNDEKSSPNKGVENNRQERNDQIRRSVLEKLKPRGRHLWSEDNKSDRATHILDLMESFHEPTGSLYDTIIASHGVDSLKCISYFLATEQGLGDDQSTQKQSLFYQQAWKSAKSALQLLNRSEELFIELGQSSSRLPSVSSYVMVMDVWKALAVGAEEVDEKKKRDEALEVVRNLRQRRLKVYTLDRDGEKNGRGGGGGHNNLPQRVATMTVGEVLEFATNLLRESVPWYQLKIEDPSKIGTWHFNQLIFDLAKHPQPFSGSLAQDLLDYMMYTVKKASPPEQNQGQGKQSAPHPNVPKPNVATINGVLKAWMVTPNEADVARHAEAILAKLAIWQSEGILWSVSADTISYNTCINCWKESGIPGAAHRATEILRLMEDDSTMITPDVISYTTCIGAWAVCASRDRSAGRCAEEILMRMHQRNIDAGGNEHAAPRPTTRCFNAVLLAYANGRQIGGGRRALELLRFMESLHSEGYADLSPDRYTFNIIMKALLCCGEMGASDKAHQLLQRMEASYKTGDTSLKPDLLSYNTVLDAFSKEGDSKSSERLLEKMLNSGDDMVKPNSHSYTAVLSAWSRNENKARAVRRAEELFDDIEGRYAAGLTDFRADTSVYNALINCWAKSGEKKALFRVTQILSLMEELGLKGGDSDVQPNSRTYCAVLDTLANSKNNKACNESLEILKRMEDFYSEGYDSVRPCARAYSIVLSTIARSRRKRKAFKAQELLHRMESEYRGGNSACRPNIYSYNAVLNAAAFSSRDEMEQEEAFKVACLTFDELRMSDYLQPSHVSYGTFLKAIKKLMPESDVRDNLVKGLFRKSCREGLASDFVLKEMADLSTPGLYQSLLEGVTNEYGNLPKSWSANVK